MIFIYKKKWIFFLTIFFAIYLIFIGLNINHNFSNIENLKKSQLTSSEDNKLDADVFMSDLKTLSDNGGGTYNLVSDVDFTTLDNYYDNIDTLNNVVIEGNGHTLSNRNRDFLVNDTLHYGEDLAFIENLKNSKINDLNFDNFMLPFFYVENSSFNNISYENVTYEGIKIYLVSEKILDSGENFKFWANSFGLFAYSWTDSNMSNSSFENINFIGNTLDGAQEQSVNSSIIVAPIAIVKTLGDNESIFDNIFVDRIKYERNTTEDKLEYQLEQSFNYGHLQSIFLQPLIGFTEGHKDNNKNLKITMNNIFFNEVQFLNNESSVLNSQQSGGYYYDLVPSITLNTILNCENIYSFNTTIDQSETQIKNRIYTGPILEINNYWGPSSAEYLIDGSGISFKSNIPNDIFEESTSLIQIKENKVSIDEIRRKLFDSENGEEETKTKNVDKKYWNIKEQGNESYIYMINKPDFSDKSLKFEDDIVTFEAILRQGLYFWDSPWTVNFKDVNEDTIINTQNINSGEKISISINSKIIGDPTKEYELEITNNIDSFLFPIDTEKIIPQFELVSNKVENNQLVVNWNYQDSYSLIESINIRLYQKNKLIEEKFYSKEIKNINETNSDQIIFDSFIDKKWEEYYIEFDVQFIDRLGNSTILDYNYINFNDDSSLKFSKYQETIKLGLLLGLIFGLILLLIFLLFLIWLTFGKVKKSKANQVQLKNLEEEYGITLSEIKGDYYE